MSTHVSDVKSSCFQNQAHTERVSVSLQTTSAQEQRVGTTRSFQDTSGHEKRLTRASPEHVQSSKNLCVRQRIVSWTSAPESPSESHDQALFASFYSARFPSNQSDGSRTHTRTAKPVRNNEPHAQSDAVRTEPDVQHLETFCEKIFLPISLTESTPKDEDVSNSQELGDTHHWQNHAGHEILEGAEHGIALCDTIQPTKKVSQRESVGSDSLTELPITQCESAERKPGFNDPLGQNAEGPLSHSNLIPVSEGNGSKASTDCQFSACSSAAIKQALSSSSFPESHPGNKLETESRDTSSAEEMFTSTLVSVLAPHWSESFQRHKRGVSEGEPGLRWSGQNMNLPETNQNIRRRSFFLNQMQAQGGRFDELSNKLREPAGINRYTAEWKESPQNLSSPLQSRREVFRTGSVCPDRETVDQMQEFAKESRPSLSLQLSDYRRMSQSVDHAESYSPLRSRPSTSTMLLSSRRTNSRNPNSESLQMSKQLSTSVSTLVNVPSKSILRTSQQNLHLVSQNDPTNERTSGNNFSASERTSDVEKSVSPSTRVMEASRRPLFLRTSQDLNDFTNENLFANDISNKPSQITTRVRLLSIPATRSNQPETFTSVQRDSDVILGKQEAPVSNTGPMEQTITHNENLQKDSNANNPRRAADFLSTWSSSRANRNTRFLLNNQNLNSHKNPISDSITKSQTNQTSTENLNSSTCVQSDNTYNISSASQTSPEPIQLNAISPSAGLTSISSDQAGQGSVQNANTSDKLSTSWASSTGMRTFSDSLSFSPKRDFPVEGPSTLHKFQNYLNSRRKLKESNQIPVNQANPQSPSEFPYRRGHTSSIYSYLRETTPSKTTQICPTLTSSSPQTSSLKQDRFQILRDDKNAGNFRFSFDYSPVEHNGFLTRVSSSNTAPQSLPPDTERPVPRLSKSPYSNLISSRQRLNSTASSPGPYHHSRSVSFDSTVVGVNPPHADKGLYHSVHKDRFNQRTSLGSVGFDDNQDHEKISPASSVSVSTLFPSLPISPENTQSRRLPDHRTSNLNSNATHPQQADAVIKKIPSEKRNGMFSSQHDKAKLCAADILNSKEPSSPLNSATMSEAARGKETLQTCEALQVNPYSKNSHFVLGNKDNVPRSAPSADMEDSTFIAGEKPEFNTAKKLEQLLYISDKGSNPSKVTKCSYFSIPREKLMQRTPGSPTGSGANQLMVRIEEITVSEDNTSQKSLEARYSDHLSSALITKNTQPDTVNEKVHHVGLKGILSSQREKGNTRAADTNSKEPPKSSTVSEAVQGGTVLETHEALQGNSSAKSKRSIFSLISRKDNVQTSASSGDNGDVIHKKGDLTGFKTKKMLNRLKLTLGVKPSEDDDIVRKKTENQQPSDLKAFNSSRKEELKRHDSPTLKSQKSHNSEITSMRESGKDSSPMSGLKPETQEISANVENHKRLGVHQFLRRPRSPNWPRSEPIKKEEERGLETSWKSQKSPNSQITFLRESGNSPSPLSDCKPERRAVSPNADDHKRLDVNRNRLLGSPISPNYPQLESAKKEEERGLQRSTSPKSPNSQNSFIRESGHSDGLTSENLLNTDNHKGTDKNRRQLLARSLSPNWPKPDFADRSATLPRGGKSSLTPSQSLYSIELLSDDVQDDNVFFSPARRRNTSVDETEDDPNWDKNTKASRQHSMGAFRSSSCVDLMYGLPRGRSISVSSVVSGRPSGPGRISTGSKQGSVSDLSSLDGFVSKSRHSSIGSPIGSPRPAATAYSGHVVHNTFGGSAEWSPPAGQIKSPVTTEASSFPWDTGMDPTPPSSPPTSRRISQVASPSSSKSSPDCVSPRGFLPSRSYKTTLSVFEESDSETTTDDEYFLNSDDEDEQETEL